MPAPEIRYESIDDLFASSTPTSIFKDVEAAIQAKISAELFDPEVRRMNEAWSFLSGKVVGAEDPDRMGIGGR